MGNKQGKAKQDSALKKSHKKSGQNETMDGDVVNFFKASAHMLPFIMSEEQFESIHQHFEVREFSPDSIIMTSGSQSVGIFMILSGACNAVASDNETILSVLQQGSFFAELSSIYNIPCTCTLVSAPNVGCRTLFLSYDCVQDFIFNRDIILLEKWFVEKRYIDCSSTFDSNFISKQITEDALKDLPIFANWSNEAVEALCKSVSSKPLTLFPPNSIIFNQEDTTPCAYVLVKGKVEVTVMNHSLSILLDSNDGAVMFCDEQIFCGTKRIISAQSVSLCHVFAVSSKDLHSILEYFSPERSLLLGMCNRWKKFVQEREQLTVEYGCLDFMCLKHVLKKNDRINEMTELQLYDAVLSLTFDFLQKGERCGLDITEHRILFVLQGSVNINLDTEQKMNLNSYDSLELLTSHSKCSIEPLGDVLLAYLLI